MFHPPTPIRIVSRRRPKSSPGYSDIHPIEDDPERRFYRELEDRSDDEMEDGRGDEYYTPTQSPRESTDSETEHERKRRGSTKKMNPESREERTLTPRESIESETQHKKKGRGSWTRSGFIIDKEERALNKHHLNKAYWEKHYQISIPEEVWTK